MDISKGIPSNQGASTPKKRGGKILRQTPFYNNNLKLYVKARQKDPVRPPRLQNEEARLRCMAPFTCAPGSLGARCPVRNPTRSQYRPRPAPRIDRGRDPPSNNRTITPAGSPVPQQTADASTGMPAAITARVSTKHAVRSRLERCPVRGDRNSSGTPGRERKQGALPFPGKAPHRALRCYLTAAYSSYMLLMAPQEEGLVEIRHS